MKKTLLAVLGLVASISLFAACDSLTETSTDSTSTSSSSSAHEHSWASTWSKDDTHHWHACTGEDCEEKNDNAAHSGGTATCEDKAVCTVCGQAYGALAAHVYDQEVVENTYLKSEATCKDAAVYYKSCECGAFDNGETAATFVSGTPTSAHTPEADDNDCTTAIECSVCGVETTAANSHAYDNACDTACNNAGCTAGNRTTSHTPEADDNDCTTAIECSECGVETTAANSHVYDNACDTSCNNEGCTAGNRTTSHTPEADDNNCTTATNCSICGAETTAAKKHTPSEDWGQDALSHWRVCAECDKNYNLSGHMGGEATCTTSGTCEDCGYEYLPATGHTFEEYECKSCGLNVVEEVFGAGVSITNVTSSESKATVTAGQDGSLILDKDWWVNLTLSGLTIPKNATAIKLTAKTGNGSLPQYAITGAAQNYTDQNIPLASTYSDIIIPLTNGQGTELTMFNLIAGGWALSLKKVEFICVDANDVVNDVFGTTGASIAADPSRGNANSAVYGTNDGALAFGNSWWSQTTLTGVTIPTNATEVKMTLKYVQTAPGNGFSGNLILNFGCGEYTIQPTAAYAEYTFTLTTGQGAAMPRMDFCVEEKGMVYLSKVEFTTVDPDSIVDPDTNTSATHINFSSANITLGDGTLTTSSLKQDAADGRTYLEVTPTAGDPWWNGAIVNFTDNRENTNVKANGTYTKVKISYKIVGNTNAEGLSLRLLGVDGANNVVNTGPDGTTDGYINLASVEGASAGWVEATFDIKYANPQTITGLDFGVKGYTPTICIDYIEFIV